MKKYGLLSFLFLLLFLSGPILQWTRIPQPTQAKEEMLACKIVLPSADKWSEKSGQPAHYKGFRSDPGGGQDRFAGIAYLTTDVVPVIKGYGGPIKIMVGVLPDGTVSKIHLLSHGETLSYVSGLNGFLNQFEGKSSERGSSFIQGIDAITGATISSQAITSAVEKSLGIMVNSVLGQKAIPAQSAQTQIPWDQITVPVLLFMLGITGIISRIKYFRWAALLGGFLYFGILKKTMVSVVQIAGIGLMQFPDFAQSPLWYALTGLTLVCACVWGLIFCGSLCPFAALEEFMFYLSRRVGIKILKPEASLDAKARYLKYAVLCSAVLVSWFMGHTQAVGIEPYLTLFTGKGTALAWALVCLMLIAALFNFRFWCKYLCPVGACLGLLARKSPFRIRLEGSCEGCRSCSGVCPTGAITLNAQQRPVIDHPECILCGNCLRECSKKALSLRTKRNEK